MTDKLIEQIKADCDAGTPGPWVKDTHHKQGHNRLVPVWYVSAENGVGVAVQPSYSDPDHEQANARRIARVPDYEARILADAEVIKAAEVLVQRIIGWSSDNIMEDNCRDWLGHVEPAIDDFNRAMQGRAALTKENNDEIPK